MLLVEKGHLASDLGQSLRLWFAEKRHLLGWLAGETVGFRIERISAHSSVVFELPVVGDY